MKPRWFIIVLWTLAWLLRTALHVPMANGQVTKLQGLLTTARREASQGTFVVYASNPREEKTRQGLFHAFKKKYGLPDFKVEWLSLFPSEAVPRIISEFRAGKSGPTVFMSSWRTLIPLDQEGLLEPIDWAATFSGEFPDIKEAAVDRVPLELRGKWVVIYDGTRSLVFNTDQLSLKEVPENFDGLANPKWARKFAMSGGGGGAEPFDAFSLVWGEERTLDAVKKLLANRPIFKKNVPPVVNAVAAGEAAIGLGSIHEAERLKKIGAPVDWRTYGDYIPVTALGYSVAKNSLQPNLGRLFIAWLAMDGMNIYEEMEFSSRVTRKESALYRIIKERAPNAKILAPANQKEYGAVEVFSEKVLKILATATLGR